MTGFKQASCLHVLQFLFCVRQMRLCLSGAFGSQLHDSILQPFIPDNMAVKRRPAKNLIVLEPSEHNERLNPDLVGESLNIIPAYTGAVDTDKADVFIRINQKVAGILICPDFDFAVHGVEVNELCRVVTIDDMGYLMKEREPERVSACSAEAIEKSL